ncbi:MAG TPA: DUF3606 domain-containing protein [Ramlibacter sp.]|nr:DUF3606 domain-containing protein [Ramlibacter sp.]
MLSEDVLSTPTTQITSEQAAARREIEMLEWAKTMRIPPARLKQAVSAVGITPRKIREYLRHHSG